MNYIHTKVHAQRCTRKKHTHTYIHMHMRMHTQISLLWSQFVQSPSASGSIFCCHNSWSHAVSGSIFCDHNSPWSHSASGSIFCCHNLWSHAVSGSIFCDHNSSWSPSASGSISSPRPSSSAECIHFFPVDSSYSYVIKMCYACVYVCMKTYMYVLTYVYAHFFPVDSSYSYIIRCVALVCMYVYVCMKTYMYVRMYVHAHFFPIDSSYSYIIKNVSRVCLCMHVYLVKACMYVRTYVYTRGLLVLVYKCVSRVYVCMCTFIHTIRIKTHFS
jgi:hypothetical protein